MLSVSLNMVVLWLWCASFYGFYGCAQDYYLHGSLGSLDFHYDKQPKCGEGCSEPQFSAVGNCSVAPGGNAEDFCKGHSKFNELHCEACHDSEHYSTILFGKHARSVIAAHPADVPLFLYLPSQDTHGPADVPINYLAPYMATIQDPVRRQLAAKLSVLDELIKNVTDALEAKGMLKDCLIVYTAGTCLYSACCPIPRQAMLEPCPSDHNRFPRQRRPDRAVYSWADRRNRCIKLAPARVLDHNYLTCYYILLPQVIVASLPLILCAEENTTPTRVASALPLGSLVGPSMLQLRLLAAWHPRNAATRLTTLG